MAELPGISMITVTFNSAKALTTFGRPLEAEDIEWIVVDNASGDDSAEIAESLGARVIRLDQNIGFGAANNVGFRHAAGGVIGIVNPDVEVTEPGIRALAAYAAEHDVLVGPQLVNADLSEQPNGRGFPTMLNKVLNRLAPSEARRRGFQRFAAPSEVVEVVWLTGAAVFAKKSTLDELGGFDEDFFVYYEDVDLGIRAARAGRRSLLLGDVRWIHGWAREAQGGNLSGWKLEARGARIFYGKHPALFFLGRVR